MPKKNHKQYNRQRLLEDFLIRPHQELRQGEVKIGDVTIPFVDFSNLPVHAKFVALMPQWDFLDFLAERAKRYPCFRLLMSAEVDGLIGEEGSVAGVAAKTKDGQLMIRADLRSAPTAAIPWCGGKPASCRLI